MSSLFHRTSQTVLDMVADRNRGQLPTFINAGLPLVVEAAQAAFLLSTYIHGGARAGGGGFHRTFFCNSSVEALHGAIKLARDLVHRTRAQAAGRILICDGTDRLPPLFDPLRRGPEEALIPGVCFATTPDEARARLSAPDEWAAVVAGGDRDWPLPEVRALSARCRESGIPFILDLTPWETDALDERYAEIGAPPDLLAWGEAMTDRQVPFGAFSASERAHRPWTTVAGFLKHSSTYSGNGLALGMMIDHVCKTLGWPARFPEVDATLAKVAAEPGACRRAFERYVNPLYLYYYDFVFLDGVVERASGSTLFVRGNDGKRFELIDAVGANGAALRGHNPADVVPEVVERHDAQRDYWSELARELAARTGLEHAFPAVSGASAVEIALTLALLAAPERGTILTFKDNYGGKTLLALAVTRTAAVHQGFAPTYPKVVTIDPRAADARQILERELRSGTVGLVWLERVQGRSMDPIPRELLKTIEEHREEMGYRVGLDEVYLGTYRTGPIVQAHDPLGAPDLVTLSKGLSDMTFPMAVALASEGTVAAARATRADLVERLRELHRNQLGAHVALHALEKVDALGLPARVGEAGERLRTKLAEVAAGSPLIKRVEGRGLAVTLSMADSDAALLLARLARERGGVLLNGARLTPALTISDDEIDRVVDAVSHRPGLAFGLRRQLDKLRTRWWYLGGKLRAG